MKHEKQKNLSLIMLSAAILAAVNMGIWLAAQHGTIAPIGDHFLWIAFAVLNVASLVWAISLLGLQPLVVAIAYVVGGFLAFKGVQGIDGIHVAEITSAGATYGAFGALVIGNYTTKVRLSYFSKRQVPFIFIIVALLVFNAALNSDISSTDQSVILNAVVFPFVLAGVIIGLVWSVVNRYGIGHKVDLSGGVIAIEQPAVVEESDEVKELETSNMLKIQMPEAAVVEEEELDAVPVMMEKIEVPEEVPPPVEESIKPEVAKEEEFFPLEIDKDTDFVLQEKEIYDVADMVAELDGLDEDPDSLKAFDSSLFDSVGEQEEPDIIMEDPPAVSLPLTNDEQATIAEHPKKTEIAGITLPEPVPAKSEKSTDWLSGHLDLLNKL